MSADRLVLELVFEVSGCLCPNKQRSAVCFRPPCTVCSVCSEFALRELLFIQTVWVESCRGWVQIILHRAICTQIIKEDFSEKGNTWCWWCILEKNNNENEYNGEDLFSIILTCNFWYYMFWKCDPEIEKFVLFVKSRRWLLTGERMHRPDLHTAIPCTASTFWTWGRRSTASTETATKSVLLIKSLHSNFTCKVGNSNHSFHIDWRKARIQSNLGSTVRYDRGAGSDAETSRPETPSGLAMVEGPSSSA